MKVVYTKSTRLAVVGLFVVQACIQPSPSGTTIHETSDTAQILLGTDVNKAVLRVGKDGVILSQWKNEHCLMHLFDAGGNKAPVLELFQYDSAKMQFKFNASGRLVEANEILAIDTTKYLNQSWKYDAFGTLRDQSTFYRHHFLEPAREFIVLTSAFPWFKDSLVFTYSTSGGTRRIAGTDSVIVPLGIDRDLAEPLIGILSEIETRLDSAGDELMYSRDFYVRLP